MKTTLLLCAGLLTLIGAIPAAATPVLDVAQFVSQAAINPIYMQYEGIKGSCQALDETASLIADVDAPSEGLDKVGRGVVILSNLIEEAAEANTSTDAAGLKIVDRPGFAASLARALNNKNPELVSFAAAGWEISEKRAKTKIAGLLKNPTWDNTNSAIIAILIGMLNETDEATQDTTAQPSRGIWRSMEAAKTGWIELESVSAL